MTWLGIVLLILVLLAVLYVALACPHLPAAAPFATARSMTLNAALAPFVDASQVEIENMEGGAFFHVGRVQAGRALCGLHGSHEGGPGRFLLGGQFQLRLEGVGALRHAGLVALLQVARFAGLLRRGTCRRRIRGCWLGQNRQGQGGQNSGGGDTVLQERHGVGPFSGWDRRHDRVSG